PGPVAPSQRWHTEVRDESNAPLVFRVPRNLAFPVELPSVQPSLSGRWWRRSRRARAAKWVWERVGVRERAMRSLECFPPFRARTPDSTCRNPSAAASDCREIRAPHFGEADLPGRFSL